VLPASRRQIIQPRESLVLVVLLVHVFGPGTVEDEDEKADEDDPENPRKEGEPTSGRRDKE